MKTPLALLSAVLVMAGCECGPGVACRSDAECVGGTSCETLGAVRGYCVLLPPGADAGPDGGDPGPDAGADAGIPSAIVSVAPIDFGLVGCGRPAATRSLELTNAGTAPLTFSTAVAGSSGFTVDPPGAVLDGGAKATLIVSAAALQSATPGAAQLATLVITTNDPARAKIDVALKMTAAGVTLALTPGIASFGLVPVNTSAPPVPLTLTNFGNLPATVSLAQPSDAQFSLGWNGAPAAVTVAPGASLPGLAGGFRPTKSAPSSSSAGVSVAEAICGISLATIPLTGQGTNGAVGLSTGELFFGLNGRVDCGTQAANRTFTLSNTGNQAFSWTGTLGRGASSPFTVTPSSGTVPASTGSTTLTVSSAAIPAEATTAAEAFGDTLSIVTDVANDSSHPIILHQTANGAALAFAPAAIDFGMVPINSTASAPLTVINGGNAPASVTLSSSNGRFSLSPSGTVAVAGASSGAFTSTFAPSGSVVEQTAAVSISLDGGEVLCAPLPAPMTMSGTGTSGSVSYSPVALDFGSVNCGATAAPKTVTFSNSGNQSYTLVPALGKGASSAFTVAMSPDSGVVASDGGTVVITVTPRPLPQQSAVTPNLYGDTLTVSSDVSGDLPHDIPLRQTARGAIFAISSSSLEFGSVAVGVTASSQFTITNSGNADGTIGFTPAQPAIFALPTNVAVNAGNASIQTGTFTPQSAISYSDLAAATKSAGTILCQPLPFAAMSLAGAGATTNVVMLSASSLGFGLVRCGSTAPAQTLTVTNNSSQTLSFTLSLAADAGSPYTVAGPATLAPGGSGTVTVTPRPVPATSSTTPDGFGDSLSIKATGGPVNETHIVALHQTAEGAILSFSPSSLSFSAGLGGTQSKSFTIDNTGNLSAPFTLTIGGGSPANYSVTPSSGSVGGGGSGSESVTFSAPALGGWGARNATISLGTGAARCAPLPAALVLNGTVNP